LSEFKCGSCWITITWVHDGFVEANRWHVTCVTQGYSEDYGTLSRVANKWHFSDAKTSYFQSRCSRNLIYKSIQSDNRYHCTAEVLNQPEWSYLQEGIYMLQTDIYWLRKMSRLMFK
jgi:hypothetical protein